MRHARRTILSLAALAVLMWCSVGPVSAASNWEEPIGSSGSLQRQERIRAALADQDLEPAGPSSDPEAALQSVGEMEIARLRGPILTGRAFQARLTLGSATMSLELEPFSVRAPDFRVELRGEGGSVKFLDPGPVRTVRGTIREVTGSLVTGIVLDRGLEAMIQLPGETVLWLEPVAKYLPEARRDLYALSPCSLDGEASSAGSCGLVGKHGFEEDVEPIFAASTGENCAALGGCLAEILCDTDYQFYSDNNSNPAQVQSTVESLIAFAIPRFEDPFMITHRLSSIVVRSVEAQDPYSDPNITSADEMLAVLKEQWPYGSHTSDLVHLFTGRGFGSVGGKASLGGVCGFGMHSLSVGSGGGCVRAGILIHELGHSWGSNHTSTGIMNPFGGDCNAPWTGSSLTEIPTRRDQVDGICLELNNQSPTAYFSFTCSGLSCSFNASSSTDDIGIVSYSWNFGDSITGSGVTTNHAYAATGAYTVVLTVTDTHGLQSSTGKKVSVSDLVLPSENYFTVPPCRLVDTRNSVPLNKGQLHVFNVAGNCGIPITAKAVSFNVGVASATGAGHLIFYPGNQSSGPFGNSTMNFIPDPSPRFNNAILRLATNGAGTLALWPSMIGTSGQLHFILDVYGYFSEDATPAPGAQGPFGFQAVTPCRIADTRTTASPLAHNLPQNFTVQGICGVPVGAAVAMLNPVAVTPSEAGSIQVFQAGTPVPGMATLRFPTGITAQANGARTRLSASTPDVTVQFTGDASTAGTTHLVLDAYGYFKSDAPLKYRPVTPCRLVDTRFADQGSPVLVHGQTRTFQVQGNCGIPVGAKAAMLNVVSVGPSGAGHLILYPSGTSEPATSALNFQPSLGNLANGLIVPLSSQASDLAVRCAVSDTHLVVDVFGYFQ